MDVPRLNLSAANGSSTLASSQFDVLTRSDPQVGHLDSLSVDNSQASPLIDLQYLALLDTPAEQAFDRLTRLAAKILHAPAALLSLVDGDRSFFKSSIGLPEPWTSQREMPLPDSFCQNVVAANAPLVINDARSDGLVSDKRAIGNLKIVAYLGIPLVTCAGHAFGAFAVIDTVPRDWTEDDVTTLGDLAASAMSEIELRAANNKHLRVERRLNLLESVVQKASVAVLIAEANPHESSPLRTVFVNDAYTRLTGFSSDDVIGTTDPVLSSLETDRSQTDTIRAALNSWKPACLELLANRKVGAAFWAEWNVIPIADKDGLYTHWVVLQRDISMRKAAEDALRESETRAKAILKSSLDCIIILDCQERVIEFNPAAEKTFGYLRADAIGKSLVELIVPHTCGAASLGLVQCLMDDTYSLLDRRLEMTATRANGSQFPAELFFTKIRLENPVFTAFIRDITDRKSAEDMLRRIDERFRRYFELGLIGMTFTAPDKSCIDVNEEACRILGYTRDEMLTKRWDELTHPDDLAAEIVQFEKVLAGNTDGYVQDKRSVRKDGRAIDTTISVKCLRNLDGGIDYFVGLLQDVTEQKQVREILKNVNQELEARVAQRTQELNDANQFLNALLENVQDGIIACNSKSELTVFNRAMRKFHGLTKLPGNVSRLTHESDLYHSDDLTAMPTDEIPINRAFRGEIIQNTELVIAPRGSMARTFLASGRAFYDGQGIKLGAVVSLKDITEHKQAEDVIRESEESFRLLVDGVQDYAIVMMDTVGNIISWNAGAERIKGYKTEEIVGRHFACFFSPEDVNSGWPEHVLTVAASQGRFEEEGWRVRKNGTRFWASVVVTAVRDQTGCLRGFSKVTRDITERKRVEHQLRKVHEELEQRVETRTAELALAKEVAEAANRAKSEFFSRMSHELRTPLNSILGFGQLLEMGDLNAPQRESTNQIVKGGRLLLALINEVLDIARIEAGGAALFSPQEVAVGHVIEEVLVMIQPLADQAGIRLLPPHPGNCNLAVLADLQRLKQVLLNLVSNAIKYNREGGTVAVSCAGRGEMLRISVTDTGFGIAPNKIHRLFEPFDRLDEEHKGETGTGLGLTLSKGLVEAMHGSVGVESTLGHGSTFWVELPLIERTVETKEGTPTLGSHHSKKFAKAGTVLYIEDNPSNLRLVERIFKFRPGVRLLSAALGRHGIDLAREHHPDLILLDLHLPDIEGDEVMRQLQDDTVTREIPVIVLSADATSHLVERFQSMGVQNYLVKPLDVRDFLELLDETLSKGTR